MGLKKKINESRTTDHAPQILKFSRYYNVINFGDTGKSGGCKNRKKLILPHCSVLTSIALELIKTLQIYEPLLLPSKNMIFQKIVTALIYNH